MTNEIPEDLLHAVACAMATADTMPGNPLRPQWYRHEAEAAILAVRAWDREQRAKLDASLAPRSDPDDYRDLPVSLTQPVTDTSGLTTNKRD